MKNIGKKSFKQKFVFIILRSYILFPYPDSYVNSYIIQMFDAHFNLSISLRENHRKCYVLHY